MEFWISFRAAVNFAGTQSPISTVWFLLILLLILFKGGILHLVEWVVVPVVLQNQPWIRVHVKLFNV
jgi:hypothetical protein